MATYYVISTTSSDDGNAAYRDEAFARTLFEDIALTGRFVRLIAWAGDEPVELDRRNGPPWITAPALDKSVDQSAPLYRHRNNRL